MTRVVTFGEVMLRLRSPRMERLLQSPALEATFGGAEANVKGMSRVFRARHREFKFHLGWDIVTQQPGHGAVVGINEQQIE